MTISVFMLFHHEWNALIRSLESVEKFYPDAQVILGRDTLEFSRYDLVERFNPVVIESRSCMQKFLDYSYNLEGSQHFSSKEVLETVLCHVQRLKDVAEVASFENILCLEPDGFMRFKSEPSLDMDLDSLEANKYPQEILGAILEVSGRPLPISGWGFVVGWTNKNCLLKISAWCDSNQELLKKFAEIDHRFAYMDYSIPILAHLSGSKVGNSKQVEECNRNRFWRLSRKPLLHQHKYNH
jgi:hypothetical protein